ncbi:AlpA family phage regulatory protein [Roseateles sp. DC23W]|uniref:AlpA family phage regulatory protein n=1 Tax=Pelomonas dachongensis TaxID=3299029 RepID=A0ABW7EV64_9BURK
MRHMNQRDINPQNHPINSAEAQTGHTRPALDDLAPVQVFNQPRHNLLRLAEVMRRTAIGRTSIYQMIKLNTFPRPVKVGSASLWIDVEISDWITQLMAARGQSSQ